MLFGITVFSSITPTTSTAVIFQNDCHLSDIFVCFCCFRPSALALHLQSTPHPPQTMLCHRNTVASYMNESLNAFTNISHIFATVNHAVQENVIPTDCSTFFSMLIYNTSTKCQTYDIAKHFYTASYRRIDFKLGM